LRVAHPLRGFEDLFVDVKLANANRHDVSLLV
jgi:hypothetical protein